MEQVLWTLVVAPIVNLILLPFLIKWLRDKAFSRFVDREVLAAEEKFGARSGSVKKAYVRESCIIKTNGKKCDRVIDAHIDSSVRRMKRKNLETKTTTETQKENTRVVRHNKDTLF